jgi:flagellar FliL protein
MAEANAAAVAAEGAAPAGARKKGLVPILIASGAVLGGLVASLVVAPRIIARMDAKAAPDSTAARAGDGQSGGEGEHAAGGETKMVELENIIVNPAGSQGTRFLMTTVVVSVPNDLIQKQLAERKVELRDQITTILESQTMNQLTTPGARDSVKARVGAAVAAILGPKVHVRIFIPQFVIQ